jgi:Na+-driven multidrug efflux pump
VPEVASTSPAAPAVAPPARPLGALLRLAWPIVVSRSTQVVIGLSDAAMVAHLGAAELAATTTGGLNAGPAPPWPGW